MGFRGSSKSDKNEQLFTLKFDRAAGGRASRRGKAVSCSIELAGSHSLNQLHDAVRDAYDFDPDKTWEFQVGGKRLNESLARRYGPPDSENDQMDDAGETTIDDLKLKEGKSFFYIFDLADPTDHSVEVLKVDRANGRGAEPTVRFLSDAPARNDAPRATKPAAPANPSRPSAAAPAPDAQAAANSYLLVMLLQRLEAVQPGLTHNLLEGIEADRAAVAKNIPNRDFVEKVFDEALKTVRQAAAGI